MEEYETIRVYSKETGAELLIKDYRFNSAIHSRTPIDGKKPEKSAAKEATEKANEAEDAIRQAAKEAGISNWHNKKIENLQSELKGE